jgi:hypothetical protein
LAINLGLIHHGSNVYFLPGGAIARTPPTHGLLAHSPGYSASAPDINAFGRLDGAAIELVYFELWPMGESDVFTQSQSSAGGGLEDVDPG